MTHTARAGRLRLEPWGVDYLGSLQDAAGFVSVAGEAEEDGRELSREALSVELPLGDWRGLVPTAPPNVARVLFLDGVRRIEARVLLEDDAPAFGALGSCAVGAVACHSGGDGEAPRAEFVGQPTVERWCTLAGGRADLPDLTLSALDGGQRLSYRTAASDDDDVDAPVRLLHAKMLEAERNLTARLRATLGDGLLISDGPRPLLGDDRRVLGYLKTVQVQRLPADALVVVRGLEEGERSPLYVVGDGEHARFEWYLRLRDPRPWLHTLAGSVRLQGHAGPDPRARLDWMRAVADWTCVALPRFATRSHQDPRAPQQLLPVRALEQTLRRRLGSAPLLRRRLVAALSDELPRDGLSPNGSPGPRPSRDDSPTRTLE